MGRTLANIRSLVREYIDDRNADRWSDAQLLPLINEAQWAIQDFIDQTDERYFIKGQLYNVVSTFDAYEFALPTDFKKVVRVERQVAGKAPIPAEWVDFTKRHEIQRLSDYVINSETVPVEAPQVYLRGTKIGVIAPNDSYTMAMWYTYQIPELTIDADEPEIPDPYRNLVAIHAAKLTKGEDDGALSSDLQKVYQDGIARMIQTIEKRQVQEPSRVHVSEPSEYGVY